MSQYCLPDSRTSLPTAGAAAAAHSNFFNLQQASYMPTGNASATVQSPAVAAAAAANMSNMYQYYLNQPYIYTWVSSIYQCSSEIQSVLDCPQIVSVIGGEIVRT